MLVEHADGEQEIIGFEKDVDEELGAEFESAVFGKIRQCANNCYFCFVDQVASDMRSSLYIKDDDYRLSFLYGNFITMTNLNAHDLERIKRLLERAGMTFMRAWDGYADEAPTYTSQRILVAAREFGK